jgi:hypothetical protein
LEKTPQDNNLEDATKQAALSLLAVCKAATENDKQHRLLLH